MVKIELSNYGTVFYDTQLKNLKSKNFFYGKNGTGKSTLCELIRNQMDKDYDVRVFQGFESVLGEDKRLNAIVLGEENKKIQKQVDEKLESLQIKYSTMRKKQEALNSLIAAEGVEKNQILLNYEKAKGDLEKQEQKIGSFYQKAASELTIQFNFGRSYNRNNFKEDILISKKLSIEEQKKLLQILSENEKQRVLEKGFPSINLEAYLKSTNDILQKKVEAKTVISELENDSKKRAFAERGLELHCESDRCAFCGGEVTESRITELETYFKADEVIKLQSRVKECINKITIAIRELEEINLLDQSQFYSQFDVNDLNQKLQNRKMEQVNFLEACTNQLEEKKKNLFESINPLQKEIPEDFFAIKKDITDLIKKNNDFTQNIEQNKRTAKKRLKLNSVAEKCEESNYERLQGGKATFENVRNDAKKILESEIEKVSKDKEEIGGLIEAENLEIKKLQEKIKNPKIITQTINDKLSKSGKHNLKLKYIEPEKHYQILNSDGSTRDINEISTGEKNIISFLYFLGSLSSPDLGNGQPKLIIFDDPMNSNDDTMQYLIISEIEKLYNTKNLYEHFILLTHNSHFYLKVTYARRERRDGKNAYETDNFIRMNSDGKLTSFMYLKDKKEDFATQYGSLWKELKFLFEHDKKDFMCNTIRRIIETYVVFNGVSGNKDAESKMLFNTNSHYSEIGDLETDTNGYTREQIIEFLKLFFQQNNAEKHFNNYWKK